MNNKKYNIERENYISEMEKKYDKANKTINNFERYLDKLIALEDTIKELEDYYTSSWLKDYEADEKGLIRDDLKRGILSEDGLYNVFYEYYWCKDQLKKKAFKK